MIFVNWIWHLNLPPTPTYQWCGLGALRWSIFHVFPLPSQYHSPLENREGVFKICFFHFKEKRERKVIHGNKDQICGYLTEKLSSDVCHPNNWVSCYACDFQWGNGTICWLCSNVQGFAKNPTLLLFILVLSYKPSGILGKTRVLPKSNTLNL